MRDGGRETYVEHLGGEVAPSLRVQNIYLRDLSTVSSTEWQISLSLSLRGLMTYLAVLDSALHRSQVTSIFDPEGALIDNIIDRLRQAWKSLAALLLCEGKRVQSAAW